MDPSDEILLIHEQIVENNFDRALEMLSQIDFIRQHYPLDIINLQARVVLLKKVELNGTQSDRDIDLERNKIRMAILKLTQTVSLPDENDTVDVDTALPDPFLEELLRKLGTTSATFKAQRQVRLKLVASLQRRIKDVRYHNAADYLHDLYDRMTPSEIRLQRIIRGYTENIIRKVNLETLQLMQDNRQFIHTLDRLEYLERHLLIWNSKFESIFDEPSVCLIYVGPDEGMRFPTGIEEEIRQYLDKSGS